MWKNYYVRLFSGLLVRLWTISVTPGMLCDDISYSHDVLWVDQLLSPFRILCEISVNLGMMCLDISYSGMFCEISVTMGMLCECQSLWQCCERKPVTMDARWISVSLKALWGYQKVKGYMWIFITLGLLDEEICFVSFTCNTLCQDFSFTCFIRRDIYVYPLWYWGKISTLPYSRYSVRISVSPMVFWRVISLTCSIL